MKTFQRGQHDEISCLETEIANLARDAENDPDGLCTQVHQLRAELDDFERRVVCTHEDLCLVEEERDMLCLEIVQSGKEI
ncbi:hypothetical protein PHMEG_00021067 [Phytophthora megakarya]|uniref:Uncharacterized protein n=1 Tax=Phytophthora megakarya TaxID=4795 RepID=A0A225VNR2_9STRA|nr:hypothetical protein PHMEG_00021067 [Phytophthora megakarya]